MSDKHTRAQQYAQAVVQAMLEKWQAALDGVVAALNIDKKLAILVKDARADLSERVAALNSALPTDTPIEVSNLLKLLLQEGDLDLLQDISGSLARVATGQKQSLKAEITSAIALNEEDKESLRRLLRLQHGEDLIFTFQIDPALLGGLRVRVGDRLIDTSIANRLSALRESLISVAR